MGSSSSRPVGYGPSLPLTSCFRETPLLLSRAEVAEIYDEVEEKWNDISQHLQKDDFVDNPSYGIFTLMCKSDLEGTLRDGAITFLLEVIPDFIHRIGTHQALKTIAEWKWSGRADYQEIKDRFESLTRSNAFQNLFAEAVETIYIEKDFSNGEKQLRHAFSVFSCAEDNRPFRI